MPGDNFMPDGVQQWQLIDKDSRPSVDDHRDPERPVKPMTLEECFDPNHRLMMLEAKLGDLRAWVDKLEARIDSLERGSEE